MREAACFGSVALAGAWLAACVPPPPPPPHVPPPYGSAGATGDCRDFHRDRHYVAVGGLPRQGATLPITPIFSEGLWVTTDVPLECVSGWSVSHPELVRLSSDRKSLIIADGAPAGSVVKLAARVGPKETGATIRILGRDEAPLAGARTETGVGCPAMGGGTVRRVGELEFTAEGRFSVTYQPFETYKDYWGTYTYDPATGALVMKVEGGNAPPADADLSGTARVLPGGKLELSDIFFGSSHGAPVAGPCKLVFG